MGAGEGRGGDAARLALRIVLGTIFVLHGLPKLTNAAGTMDFFGGLGLPGFLGPAVGVAEVVAGPLLALGLLHRAATLVLAVIITGALALVQVPRALSEGGVTGGLERDTLILVALAALAATGPGRLAVDAVRARGPEGP